MLSPHALLRVLHTEDAHTTSEPVAVPAGGLIGRLRTAALCIQHPQISEAHALVSLRDRHLQLLALRGGLGVGRDVLRAVHLEAGQRILLAVGVKLEVVAVELPEAVLGLRCDGSAPVELRGEHVSIQVAPPGLKMGFVPEAPAHLWRTGSEWLRQVGMGPARAVAPGDRWQVGGLGFEAVLIPLGAVGMLPTGAGRLHPPMHLTAHYDQLTIAVRGQPQVRISGKPARLVYELAVFRDAGQLVVPAEMIAGEVWKGTYATTPRQRFDRSLQELRSKLKARSLRADLIHANHVGGYELHLYPGDTLELAF